MLNSELDTQSTVNAIYNIYTLWEGDLLGEGSGFYSSPINIRI